MSPEFTPEQVGRYITSKQGSWSTASTRSESSRIHTMLPFISSSNGERLYEKLISDGKQPYTVKTSIIRASNFLDYLEVATNPYKKMLKEQRNRFKNSYIPERISLTFEEAQYKLKEITNKEHRDMAFFILFSGLRAKEALKYDGSGWIMGKGARMRRVFNSELLPKVSKPIKYLDFYDSLRAVGLKPHTLRKLAATELVKKGFKITDLMHVMGWKSMQTASIYLQPASDLELEGRVKQAMGLRS